MVKPAAKREAVEHLAATRGFSRRRACGLVDLSRTVLAYEPKRRPPTELLDKMRRIAAERPRFDYRRLRILVQREGDQITASRFYRLYRSLDLGLRKRPRNRLKRQPRGPRPPATTVDHRWSMDFVGDTLANRRRPFRVLGIVDDCSRECVAVEVGDVLTSERLVRVLERLRTDRGLPKSIVVDNGPEFTAARTRRWAAENGVVPDFIQPGKPTQNAYAENFNGRLRDECLNQHEFVDLEHATALIEAWRDDYNRIRPHGSLGGRTPNEYASELKKVGPPPLGEAVPIPVPESSVLK